MTDLKSLRARRLELIEALANAADQIAALDSEIERSNMAKLGDDEL